MFEGEGEAPLALAEGFPFPLKQTIQQHHNHKNRKPLALGAARGFRAIFGSGLLSHMTLCSIIGDGELNFRVRNGVGCTLSSMATKEISRHLLKFDGEM